MYGVLAATTISNVIFFVIHNGRHDGEKNVSHVTHPYFIEYSWQLTNL